MYKEIIICSIVIIIVVGLNILTESYTKESITLMTGDLKSLKENMISEEQNEEKLNNQIENIVNNWNEKHKKLAYYIEHDELEKVETELVYLKGNIEVKEYEQGIPNLNNCIFILEHIKEKTALQIKNIF
ncbi:MAG: DUF4363 family protein [Clostridia bacterium]|nr:DUF4363 family protein [Clostridia bacterium]